MEPLGPAPDLASYDSILINSSAGKDSQAMLDYVVSLTDKASIPRERLTVVHADLGRMEWPGTLDLASEHAAHYNLRFEVVSRPQGNLLSHVRRRGMWPDAARRYCTSQHKTGQVQKLMTRIVANIRGVDEENGRPPRRVRLLNCMGMRSDESPARRKRPGYIQNLASSNGRRHVDDWLPIKDWTLEDVWRRIDKAGTRVHTAYALRMPRVSCSLCVLASKAALVQAARLRPDLAADYLEVEKEIHHDFRQNLPMRQIVELAAVDNAEERRQIENWVT